MVKMHKNMSNQEIAQLLEQMAAALEVKGDDFFRVRAYENAAASVEHATSLVKDLWEEDKLDELPGVGASLNQHLDELFRTGKVKHFLTETRRLPDGMFPLLSLTGIGAKTAYKLAKELKLNQEKTALAKLENAAKKGMIRKIEGFGEESERQILKALEEKSRRIERMLLPEADMLAKEVIEYLKKSDKVQAAEGLGSLRRKAATVGDVDIAVETSQPEKVMAHLLKYPGIKKVISTGPKTTMFLHKIGRQVDVKTQESGKWGSMLQHYTGSKMHNIHLRIIAKEKRLSLSEHGIKKGKKILNFSTEEAFYQALGMEYIPPELREDTGEIEAAAKKALPHLVELKDIKGDLHIHSNLPIETSHDEGDDSVEELLEVARKLGYEYIGLSDHNPKYSGLSEARKLDLIKRRNEAIDKAISSYEKKVKTRVPYVFKGLEVDIRADGELAISDQALKLLDYAIVSIHASFDQSKADATKRVIGALAHPKVMILGHPTARHLNKREGLDYDWDRLFEFCVKEKKYLEINSSPKRLDLPDTLVREAVKQGLKLVIDTDSHAKTHLEFMEYGVWVARRGWAEKSDIVNTLNLSKFRKLLK